VDTCAERRYESHAVKLTAIGTSAILALVAGTCVYLLDRDWASTLFLAPFDGWQAGQADLFGALGGNLPSFFHAYALASLLIILLGRIPHARPIGASLWFATAAVLECLQADQLKTLLGSTTAIAGTPGFLASIRAYIDNGHYDAGDIVAAAVGCAAAWAVSFVLEERL
jgi:hypothetical protein